MTNPAYPPGSREAEVLARIKEIVENGPTVASMSTESLCFALSAGMAFHQDWIRTVGLPEMDRRFAEKRLGPGAIQARRTAKRRLARESRGTRTAAPSRPTRDGGYDGTH